MLERHGQILTASRRGGRLRARRSRLRGSFGQAHRAQGIDQARIDGNALGIDHPGVFRQIEVFADGLDEAIAQQYSALFQHRTTDGNDAGAAKRDGAGRLGVG